jgi:3-deoxy-D-manno-octulosonic-acid transferase
MHNFRDVARLAAEAGAAVQCPPDAAGLADALASLLADPGRCAALGSAGRALVEAHLGAGQRIAAEVRGCLG